MEIISMRIALIAGLALGIAGCGAPEEAATNNSVTPTPTPAPTLAGVNLNKPIGARGESPYWTLYVAPGAITYATSSAPGSAIDFYPASPKLEGARATVTTQTPEGEPVTITLTPGPCSAGADAAPLRAEVKIGTRTLSGCAAQTRWAWQKDLGNDKSSQADELHPPAGHSGRPG